MAKDLGNSQDLVAVDKIRGNTAILKSGQMVQVLMVGGVNFALKSEEEQNIMTQAYQNFLNSVNFPIQIIVHSRKINVDKYLGTLEERGKQETSGLLQDQISEYKEFIKGFVSDYAIMEKNFFVVIPYNPMNIPSKESVVRSIPFLGGGKETPEEGRSNEEQFHENLNQLNQRVLQVKEGLFAMGLDSAILEGDQLIELFYNFYNPESVEKEGLIEKKE